MNINLLEVMLHLHRLKLNGWSEARSFLEVLLGPTFRDATACLQRECLRIVDGRKWSLRGASHRIYCAVCLLLVVRSLRLAAISASLEDWGFLYSSYGASREVLHALPEVKGSSSCTARGPGLCSRKVTLHLGKVSQKILKKNGLKDCATTCEVPTADRVRQSGHSPGGEDCPGTSEGRARQFHGKEYAARCPGTWPCSSSMLEYLGARVETGPVLLHGTRSRILHQRAPPSEFAFAYAFPQRCLGQICGPYGIDWSVSWS